MGKLVNLVATSAVLLGSVCEASEGRPKRLPPRPERTEEQRVAYLAELRALYAGPPETWPAPTLDESVEHRELAPVPRPAPLNDAERATVELGRKLFFDPRLSGSGQLACASCHDPDLGWADGRTTSFGHNRRRLSRNSPSILNSGLRETLFWDGRAATLEEQAVAVLNNADEMHSGDEVIVANVAAIPEYVDQLKACFEVDDPGIEEIALAMAAYERTVVSTGSRLDSFLRGRKNALTDEQLSGMHLFRTDARCINCHNGPLLTDDRFHNLGISHYGRSREDLGRYLVTGRSEDVGAFRTPSLRDVLATRPYMHSGLFELDEVLRLYNAGMPTPRRRESQADDPLFPTKSPLLKPLRLNDRDVGDLTAFLASLSESRRRVSPPRLPPGL